MGALTMLNEAGDVTIVWDEDQDDAMVEIIAKKMAEGCAFYVVEPRLGGLAAPKKTRVRDAETVREYRALAIPDADLRAFVGEGKGETVKTPAAPVRGRKRSKDPKEVASSEGVGVKPRRGG